MKAINIRPFIPSKDFTISKSFYKALGFKITYEEEKMVILTSGDIGFFLQDYYLKEWAENTMIQLVVNDIEAFYDIAHGLKEKYKDMKIKLIILLSISSSLIIMSCNRIVSSLYGISEPTNTSYSEMVNYLNKNDIDTTMLFTLKQGCFYSLTDSNYNIIKDDSSCSPIQYRVYKGGAGIFLGSWQICYGSLDKIGFLNNMPPIDNDNRFDFNKKLSFSNDVQIVSPIYTPIPDISQYDYVIIAFWADYLGKRSRNMLLSLQDYIKEHKEMKILLMKVYLIEGESRI